MPSVIPEDPLLNGVTKNNYESFHSPNLEKTNLKPYFHLNTPEGEELPTPEGEELPTRTPLKPPPSKIGYAYLSIIMAILLLCVWFTRDRIPPYVLTERHQGQTFLSHYEFYAGNDTAGSKGYVSYVNSSTALSLSLFSLSSSVLNLTSSPTPHGPRHSIRLEGKTRWDHGLFVIDLLHMPTGCGTWPAIWLTDEDAWPRNGEIDIIESANLESRAKTALHSTNGCRMPEETGATGEWDLAQGIPDEKTGVPDMTRRVATNCYVYDKHQWLNQGCVAVDAEDGRIGRGLNEGGGGVYVLEWDPQAGFMKSWVWRRNQVPDLRNLEKRTGWGLPYGVFPIGDGTHCPSSHFKNMRLVINLSFCGTVSGNKYYMDCPHLREKYPTCEDYVKSQPPDLEREAYWSINNITIYQRNNQINKFFPW